ncbi:MAG TPA: FAD-dependent oxidoreductase [Terriglobales bacterium]|jgi:ferredoxin-NADP reductase|nr:FAD-dependent oxidoreductase [Terriglobales bacterium]
MSTATAKWPTYLVKLKGRQEVAEHTMAFHFEKPAGFTFIPGQFIDLTLLTPSETDAEGNTRGFSIASAPDEPTIMVTTRLRDTAFKRVLQTMPLETEVKLEGPFGDLKLHNNVMRTAVFLAGGIGITPFRSILLDAAKRKLPHRVFLFYSNRRPEDAAFLDELQALEKQNTNYSFIATMTEMEHSRRSWQGERGLINKEMLEKHLKGATSPIYYIAGPPAMVAALHKMLQEAGINDDDIRKEEFAGY